MIRDCHSAKPTLRESLLSYIYNSVEEDSKMVIKQERVHRLEEHLKLSGKTLMKAVSSDDSDDQSEGSGSRPLKALEVDPVQEVRMCPRWKIFLKR